MKENIISNLRRGYGRIFFAFFLLVAMLVSPCLAGQAADQSGSEEEVGEYVLREYGEDADQQDASSEDGTEKSVQTTENTDISLQADSSGLVDSGEIGEDVSWTLSEDGILDIEGEGAIETGAYISDSSISTEGIPWYSYHASIKEVRVGEGITDLGDGLFYECSRLSKVSLPETLQKLGYWDFYDCSSLTEITLPDGLTEMKRACFSGTGLKKIRIPDSLTEIPEYAFQKCTSLKAIDLPDTVSSIASGAFYKCSSLQGGLRLPDSLTSLSDSAFYETNYAEVHFGPKLETIGSRIFYNDSQLAYVTFEGEPPSISETAFSGATITAYYPENLSSWTEENRIDYGGTISWVASDGTIDAQGTYGDSIQWTYRSDASLTISGSGAMPENNSSSGIPWYYLNESIKKLVVEEGVTSLTTFAFYHCSSLTEVELADSIITIEYGAFEECTSLTELDFLNQVETIESVAFYGCTALSSLTIPSGVTRIESSVFSGCTSLKELIIPDTVTYVGASSFRNCSSLQSVSIGSGVTSINYHAFAYCTSLKAYTVSDSNTTYASVNGYLCNKSKTILYSVPAGLTKLVIPDGIKTLYSDAIEDNKLLEEVTIPSSLSSIGSYNFTRCENLISITVDSGNTSYRMQDNILYNYARTMLVAVTGKLEEIKAEDLPSTLTSISSYAFYYHSNLRSIEIPEGISSISSYQFYNCTNLQTVTIPDSVTSIGSYAFGYCSKLSDLTLGSGISSLNTYVFYSDRALTRVILPATITSYNSMPFAYCSNLEELVFLGNVPDSSNLLLSSSMTTTIYYPADNSSWKDAVASSFGEKARLCSYGGSDYESAIHQDHVIISGGWEDSGCYQIQGDPFSYTNSSTLFRQYTVEEAGGIYFVNNNKLQFLDQADGSLLLMKQYDSLNDSYERDGILYAAGDNQIYRYDLEKKKELATVSFDGIEEINALGVDSSGRYYLAVSDDGGYEVLLYDGDGDLLSKTDVSDLIYRFVGFDSTNGRFYMEGRTSYYAWGMDRPGHGLLLGKVTGDKISFIPASYTALEQNMITRTFSCAEYLCMNSQYLHQVNAEFLGEQYLVTSSYIHSRMRLIDSHEFTELWKLDRETDTSGLTSSSYDTNSIGVRALLMSSHNSVLIAENDKELHEYDLDSKQELYTYSVSHPVFSLQRLGDSAIVIEKEDSTYYLERINLSDPDQVEISGQSSMQVGTSQKLQVNMATRSMTSSDSSVASVDETGHVSAWKAGEVVITVTTVDQRTASYKIQVVSNGSTEVTEASHKATGSLSNNLSDNNYSVWSTTMKSYLTEDSDGNYNRVEYIADTGLLIEVYDSDWVLQSSKTIDPELPIFGGYYCGSDGNYVVYGQKNASDSDSVEVMRIVKYSDSWNRLAAYSVYGANTYLPFDAGSLRMTETGDRLYIYTCHEMYAESNGTHHQANMTYVIQKSDMSLLDSYYDVMNITYGYVSHSFNQFIRTDGKSIYRVDHGDANPRAISVTRCDVEDKITSVDYLSAYKILGITGDNATGVSVGGFELSSTRCLIAVNSVDMTDSSAYSASGKRNICLLLTDLKLSESSTIWFTDYEADSKITVCTPQLVKLSSDQFMLMWEEYDSASGSVSCRFVTVDGQGHKIAESSSSRIRLSDCQPIVNAKNHVVWYTTDGKNLRFYEINPYDLSQGTRGDISQCDISLTYGSDTVTDDSLKVFYTASVIEPIVTIKEDDRTLTQGSDYEVSYEDNLSAGKARVYITGKGSYQGSVSRSFTINKISQTLSSNMTKLRLMEGEDGEISVTGIGEITAVSGDSTILECKDPEENEAEEANSNQWEISCHAVAAGKTYLVLSASGDENHDSANLTIEVEIVAKAVNISAADLSLSQDSYTYDGSVKKPSVILIYEGKTLQQNTDYTLSYRDNKEAGTAWITITGIGDYIGTIEKSYTIAKADQTLSVNPPTLSLTEGEDGSYTVTGYGKISIRNSQGDILAIMTSEDGQAASELTSQEGDSNVKKNTDGSITASFFCKALACGSVRVDITASGDENHSSATYVLEANVVESVIDLSSSAVSLSQDSYVYDGEEKKPAISVICQGVKLTAGQDYIVSYSDNINAGTAKLTVYGKGEYTGSLEKTFTITPRSISDAQIIFTSTGKISKDLLDDSFGVLDGNHFLIISREYDWSNISYSSDSSGNIVSATITIYGKGNYTGNLKQTIKPVSETAVLTSVKTSASGTTLVWQQESGAAGYEIYRVYDGSSEFLERIEGSDTTSWTDKTVTDYKAGYSYYIVSYTVSDSGLVTTNPSAVKQTVSAVKKKNTIIASNKTVVYSTSSKTYSVKASCYGGAKISYNGKASGYYSTSASGILTVSGYVYGKLYIMITSAETEQYYAASKKICVTILPPAPTLKSVKNVKGKKLQIQWTALHGHGYQIQYSTKKNFTSGVKTVNISSFIKRKYVASKLKKGKTYYVRMRTYFTLNGSKLYSSWSKVKKAKIKK